MKLKILELFGFLVFAGLLVPLKASSQPADQAAILHVLNRLA